MWIFLFFLIGNTGTMNRFLQNTLLFCLFIFTFYTAIAQQDRVKSVKLNSIPTAIEAKDATENPSVKKEVGPQTQEFKKSSYSLRSMDTLPGKQGVVKAEITEVPKTADKVFISENVTYEKEVLPVTGKVIAAEKPRIKVTSSVNHKPKTVKEDIHPVVDYSNAGINSDKRIYLEQEAKDLEREILQNAGKSDYDLVQKQKQLDDIRKMLQK